MSFINEQLAAIFVGGFIAVASKKCKIYPIPLWQEILGLFLGLGVALLLQKYCGWYSNITVTEQVRFVLGYITGRFIFRGRK